MKKRAYVKHKTEYWNGLKQSNAAVTQVPTLQATDTDTFNKITAQSATSVEPSSLGTHFTAIAACGGGNVGDVNRNSWANTIIDNNAYRNLRSGVVPFSQRDGNFSMGPVIDIVSLAYYNISAIRNTINLYRDYSISPLRIKCPNKTVKKFFQKWFEAIQLPNFMAQFFLEYYRGANVFIYKFNGEIAPDKFKTLETAFAAKSPQIPIRYIILNPAQVSLQMGPTYAYNFSKMLSVYEIQRLRDPQTPEDKQVLKSFPKYIQDQIKNYGSYPFIWAPLDTKRLYYVFNGNKTTNSWPFPWYGPFSTTLSGCSN